MRGNSFSTGLITGAVIGTVAGILMDPMKDKHSKKLNHATSGMFKNIGTMLDGMIFSK